jgi:hypothetical protein
VARRWLGSGVLVGIGVIVGVGVWVGEGASVAVAVAAAVGVAVVRVGVRVGPGVALSGWRTSRTGRLVSASSWQADRRTIVQMMVTSVVGRNISDYYATAFAMSKTCVLLLIWLLTGSAGVMAFIQLVRTGQGYCRRY